MVYKLTLQNHVEGITSRSWSFRPPAVVGRDANSQLCIEHDSISRKHCQFSFSGEGALVVKDLESMNGTYVDEQRIQHATLMPGQIVQIGALRLKIEFTDETDELLRPAINKPAGSVYATQPMETFRPVPLREEKPWWKRLFGE